MVCKPKTLEKDGKPLSNYYSEFQDANNMPVPFYLIIILDLYFHLTPITMVIETSGKYQELAKLMDITPEVIVGSYGCVSAIIHISTE